MKSFKGTSVSKLYVRENEIIRHKTTGEYKITTKAHALYGVNDDWEKVEILKPNHVQIDVSDNEAVVYLVKNALLEEQKNNILEEPKFGTVTLREGMGVETKWVRIVPNPEGDSTERWMELENSDNIFSWDSLKALGQITL